MNINIRKEMARMMAGADGNPITLHWTEWDGTETIDPVTNARIGGNPTAESESVKGFVHLVKASTVERRFGEIEAGDAIVDLPPQTTIGGRYGLEFDIYGKRYVQKEISGKLSETWDVIEGGTSVLTEFPKASMTADASSYIVTAEPSEAIDESTGLSDPESMWHSINLGMPQWLRLNLGGSYNVSGVDYLPRPGCGMGTFLGYEIYVTENPSKLPADWGSAVTSGTWNWTTYETKSLTFTPKLGRYVIFNCTSAVDVNAASAYEVWAYYYPHTATCRTVLLTPKE